MWLVCLGSLTLRSLFWNQTFKVGGQSWRLDSSRWCVLDQYSRLNLKLRIYEGAWLASSCQERGSPITLSTFVTSPPIVGCITTSHQSADPTHWSQNLGLGALTAWGAVIGEIFGHNQLRSECLQVQPVTCWHPPVFRGIFYKCLYSPPSINVTPISVNPP